MNASFILLIFAEIAITLLIVYGALNEKALIAFENRMIRRIKKSLRARKNRAAAEKAAARVIYTPVKPPRRPGSSSTEAA